MEYAGSPELLNSQITKAKTACEVSGHQVLDHFADVGKTIQMPKGAEKEIPDIILTRYACYLIAQNGDPRKQEIAFAQTYFAIQTRRTKWCLHCIGRRAAQCLSLGNELD